MIEDEGLDSWLCGEESETLQQLSVDDRNTLTERFCSNDSKTELARITDLLQTALNYSQVYPHFDFIFPSLLSLMFQTAVSLWNGMGDGDNGDGGGGGGGVYEGSPC